MSKFLFLGKVILIGLFSIVLMVGCKNDDPSSDNSTPDTTSPTVGSNGAITTANISSSGLTLNWAKASDDTSGQSSLLYLAYYSTSNNIDTVANIEANGTAVGSFTADIATKNITGLTNNTTYYFNVIVKDEAGNKTAYTIKQTTTGTPPTPGGSGNFVFAPVGTNSVTLNWTKATDTVSAQSTLKYRVGYSTSNNISTYNDMSSNATWASDWETDIALKEVTGLTSGTSYYFNIAVKNEAGIIAVYTAKMQATN